MGWVGVRVRVGGGGLMLMTGFSMNMEPGDIDPHYLPLWHKRQHHWLGWPSTSIIWWVPNRDYYWTQNTKHGDWERLTGDIDPHHYLMLWCNRLHHLRGCPFTGLTKTFIHCWVPKGQWVRNELRILSILIGSINQVIHTHYLLLWHNRLNHLHGLIKPFHYLLSSSRSVNDRKLWPAL